LADTVSRVPVHISKRNKDVTDKCDIAESNHS